jgi:hypothetical protein
LSPTDDPLPVQVCSGWNLSVGMMFRYSQYPR